MCYTISMYKNNLFRLLITVYLMTPGLVQAQSSSSSAGGGGSRMLMLLEGIGGTNSLTPKPGLGTLFDYIGLLYPWIVGTAAGVALFYGVWGGITIMFYAGNSQKEEDGKNMLRQAVMGLLLIIFSGVILNFLNPTFFK